MEKLLRYSFRIQEHCGEFFGAAARPITVERRLVAH